jgi:hypothetical protein
MIICVPVPGDALFTASPSVILEVLSPNTRRIDEVQKLRDYITIPTLEPTFSRKQKRTSSPCTAGTARASGGKPYPGRTPSSILPKPASPSLWPNSTGTWVIDSNSDDVR